MPTNEADVEKARVAPMPIGEKGKIHTVGDMLTFGATDRLSIEEQMQQYVCLWA